MSIPFAWVRACASLVCLALPLACGMARATDTAASGAPILSIPPEKPAKTSKTQKTKTKKVKPATAKVKFLPSSQETVAQRRARLKDECKGQVNAGACSGMTR